MKGVKYKDNVDCFIMQFDKVDLKSLKPNEEYKLISRNQEFRGTFCKWDVITGYHFTKIRQNEFRFPDTGLGDVTCYRPIFQKEKRQQSMERRAVNLILRKIIGDTYFEW